MIGCAALVVGCCIQIDVGSLHMEAPNSLSWSLLSFLSLLILLSSLHLTSLLTMLALLLSVPCLPCLLTLPCLRRLSSLACFTRLETPKMRKENTDQHRRSHSSL